MCCLKDRLPVVFLLSQLPITASKKLRILLTNVQKKRIQPTWRGLCVELTIAHKVEACEMTIAEDKRIEF